MKIHRLIIICSLVASCMMASCKKHDNENPKGIVFTASVEGQDEDNDRTAIVADDNENQNVTGTVIWLRGDQILLNNGTTSSTLGLIKGAGTKKGDFMTHSEYFELTPPYLAAYPAASATIQNDHTYVTFNLPQIQDMKNEVGTFANGANRMVSKSDNTELHFKNVCGGLGIRVKGACDGIRVTKIRIISSDPTEKLWGKLKVTLNGNGVVQGSSIIDGEGGDNQIDLKCDVTLSTTEATRFFIILPKETLASYFTLEVTYKMKGFAARTLKMTTKREGAAVVELNQLKSLPTFTIRGDEYFSVSDNKKVYFSRGNLQWSAIGAHEVSSRCTKPGTWRFALNQWDYVGAENTNISQNNEDWIDLFGWGTSGWNNGNHYYEPWDYNTKLENVGYGYGPKNGTDYNLPIANSRADWGVYNGISNVGNWYGMWRTLTNSEWGYVLNERGNYRFLKAKIAVGSSTPTYKGVILFPDIYGTILEEEYNKYFDAQYTTYYNETDIDYTPVGENDWSIMEAMGAIFLPAAGYREGTSVSSDVGANGYYWSATNNGTPNANGVTFSSTNISAESANPRYRGHSVRLVKDVTP